MSVAQLQLVKRKDTDNSDIDLVDLLSLPTELQYEGWQQATPAQQGQATVDDVITLLLNAGNDDTLAATLQSLDSKVKQVAWAQDPLNPIGVWLRSKLATETYSRQSFIKALTRSPLEITDPLAYQSILKGYNLGVTRMPVWEDVLASSITSSAITAHGGKVSYSIAGDAHARVAKVKTASSGTFFDTWIGVKSDRYGVNPANFVPVWTVLTVASGATGATKTADATAVSGFKIAQNFTSYQDMRPLALAITGNQTANYSDQRGKYLVLLRAQTTDATLITNVRVGHGFYSGSTPVFSYMPRYQIGGAAAAAGYRYYPLGTVKIPPIDGIFEQSLGLSSLIVAAEKVGTGSGSLYIDCLVLIPAEHIMSTSFVTSGVGYTSAIFQYIITRPDQRGYSILYKDSTLELFESALPIATNWALPSGSGVMVYAAQGATSGLSDQLTPTLTVYPSYSSLRGAA